jgi:hypothetical protein
MTGWPTRHDGERFVCPKCAGVHGLHYLTCPTLRLPQDVPLYEPDANDAPLLTAYLKAGRTQS